MSAQIEHVIRSLRHLWAQPDATIEQFAAEAVAALRPELENAERYRWLRDKGGATWVPFVDQWRMPAHRCDSQVDAAIDAALAKSGEL
jgi:hypothetical protein